MTYMRSWKSHRLTSHTWLGLNPQIGRPLSRIVGAIGLFFFLFYDCVVLTQNKNNQAINATHILFFYKFQKKDAFKFQCVGGSSKH
jgi:hypothetical protein